MEWTLDVLKDAETLETSGDITEDTSASLCKPEGMSENTQTSLWRLDGI